MNALTIIANEDKINLPVRIDKYLISQELEELYSRTYIEHLLECGKITVNGKVQTKKSFLIKINDQIAVQAEEKKIDIYEEIPKAENIPIKVIYEDDYLAIIDKAPGITVHPSPGNHNGTLVNALLHHFNENLSNGSSPSRPGIVHRLDKDTSGLLIIAKTNKVHTQLSTMIQNHEIEKKYKALILGTVKEKEGEINLPIGRSFKDRKKMAVSESGKEAITRYKVLEEYEYFSLVDITLITGRTHQIRVHFSHIFCPILGDSTYNSHIQTISRVPVHLQKKIQDLLRNYLKRQALHAYSLKFKHPVTGVELSFESPLPDDINYTISFLTKNFT